MMFYLSDGDLYIALALIVILYVSLWVGKHLRIRRVKK